MGNTHTFWVSRELDYSPFGTTLEGRSWSVGNEYRYGFQGQEDESDINKFCYDFEFRIHDARLGKFLSIDPLTAKYSYLSPYAFSENRLIDGIELEGSEWKSEHKWSDIISNPEHIKTIGDKYVKDMTYEQAWAIGAPALQMQHYNNQESYDCAEFSIYLLVEYAYTFKLSVHIEDDKLESDPTFDNDSYGFVNNDEENISFAEGDWKSFAKTIDDYYGAADLYRNPLFLKDISWEELSAGDLIGWKWSGGGYHSQTVSKVLDDEEQTVKVVQGSLDAAKNATILDKKSYPLDWIKRADPKNTGTSQGETRARKWDFDYFDTN